jgi:cytidyltransferase-like protein
MKLAAIIAEYNPFHNGHKYQIDKARKLLGEDTAIIAIMSGNYTQRGEIAIADKTARAKLAVLEGVNLVLELPFPFSSATAEIFTP